MADDSIFIAVASILQVFDIALAKDNDGNDISVEGSFTSGFMSWVFRLLRVDFGGSQCLAL
jgi:hypothetical protein